MLRRLNWKSLLVIAVIVGVAVASLAVKHIDINIGTASFERGSDDVLGLSLGLDLAGGSHLVYQAGSEETPPTDEQMEGLVAIISRRISSLGVSEPSIQRLGDDRLLIQLPGIEDVTRAKRLIGQTARLEIVERRCLNVSCVSPADYEDQPTGLTGEDLSRAFAGQDTVTGEPIIQFEMERGAARAFAEITQRIFDSNVTSSPDQLTFKIDDSELVSAGVTSPILSGSGQIRGLFTPDEARDLAIQIESGRLPVNIEVITERVVAASLGAGSLEQSLVAGLVGLALVLFFMVSYYRGAGAVAAVALTFYTILILAIFKLVPVTLTLAGVAGFILSLGMAVDANILIFERMKEELRIGRTLQFALQIGFNRAWPSIRDGNVSTLIIAGILFFFGTQTANSSVTGFAVALTIGVLTSLFSAIFISRNLLTLMVATPLARFPSLFSPETIAHGGQAAGGRSGASSERSA